MSLSTLPLGPDNRVPILGQGTWQMGETPSLRRAESEALRFGVERGLTLIDTAEMYGDGATESLLGEALHDFRDRIFLVSKVYPQNAGGAALRQACERSLQRLKTDRLDLYLLHWRGGIPLADTVDGMRRLQREGKILRWGVSNFDLDDMLELEASEGAERDCATNQVLYNLSRRGPEFDLLPWMRQRGMPLMAYSPLEQGRLNHAGLRRLAAAKAATPLQVALAWVLHQPGVIAIPKAGSRLHVEANLAAAEIAFTAEELQELDRIFPQPRRKIPLEML